MASINDLKNNNVSVEVNGEVQDPDNPSEVKEQTAKTIITNSKKSTPKPKVNINKKKEEPVEEEEFVIDATSENFEEYDDIEDEEVENDIVEDLDIEDEEESVDDFEDLDIEESSEPEEDWGDLDEEEDDEVNNIVEDLDTEEEVVEEEITEEVTEDKEEENVEEKKKPKKKTAVFADDIEMEEDLTYSEIEHDDDKKDEDDEVFDSEVVDIEDDTDENEETIQLIKDQITERLKPVSKKLDISSFSVVKKPTMNIRSLDQSDNLKVSKWVCYDQKSSFLMKEFLGSELELIRQLSASARNTDDPQVYQHLMQRYTMIYNHIVSPKPATVEAWLSNTSLYDIDDYFFGIYISAFKDTNFIPVDCQNSACNNTFLSENLPIMNMVKFPNEDVKKEFTKIYKSEPVSNNNGLFATEVIPISNNVAIGFRQRNTYNEIQKLLLDTAFINQYILTVDIISYIDAIYIMDIENKQLTPVGYKEYVGNPTKTLKSKIRKYHTVLSTLSSDEYNTLASYRAEIERKESQDRPLYTIPEIKCSKCGSVNPESETSAESLVFTRCQLAALSNTSIN